MWEQTFFASAGAEGSPGVEATAAAPGATGAPDLALDAASLALDAASLAASPFACHEESSQNSTTTEYLDIAAHDPSSVGLIFLRALVRMG